MAPTRWRANLGERASLLAAAALALDYVLNVAVAIAAGVGALVSALPVLLPHTLALCLLVLALLTLVNLRGVRSTGLAFLLPTYLFVGCLFGLIAYGLAIGVGGARASAVASSPTQLEAGSAGVSAWLVLHAFAAGCTALTGVEAVSNGMPIFRQPQTRNARRALGLITLILCVLLLGETALCRVYGVIATEPGQPGFRSLLLIAAMMALFVQVRRHYDFIARVTATRLTLEAGPLRPPLVVIPLRRWDAVSVKALRFALGFAEEVIAVQVLTGDRAR